MRIAQPLAGITLAEADVLRKAMGKKKAEVMAKQSSASSSRGARARVPEKKAEEIFGTRSRRSAGTASTSRTRWPTRWLSYQTAWLKAHYPRRLHGRAAHVGSATPTRWCSTSTSARDGHRGAAAGRERVGYKFYRRRRRARSASGWARSRTWGGARSSRSCSARRRGGRVRVAVRLLRAGGPARVQQARGRGARQSRRARLARRRTARSSWPASTGDGGGQLKQQATASRARRACSA